MASYGQAGVEPDDDEILYEERPSRHAAVDEDASDADSDFLDLQEDIAKLQANKQAFLDNNIIDPAGHIPGQAAGFDGSQRRAARGRGAAANVGGGSTPSRGRRRGPRKAPEPSLDIKLRLSQAGTLFVNGDYGGALEILLEIVQENAEILGAWTLLASIYEDMGDRQNTMLAKLFTAQLRPRDINGWMGAVDYCLSGPEPMAADPNDAEALERERFNRFSNLEYAKMCYSGALEADRDSIPARMGKANVCLELGQAGLAASQYLRVLQRRPYHLEAIRNLAEASYEWRRKENTFVVAANAYEIAIRHAMSGGQLDDDYKIEWMDVTIYAELLAAAGRYDQAIQSLKGMVRWLLGRQDETYWDSYNEDDREWDIEHTRRMAVAQFRPGLYPLEIYGQGLPIPLRAKLAIYRLKLGHEEEAVEHLSHMDPNDPVTAQEMESCAYVLKEVANQLRTVNRLTLALQYFEIHRTITRNLGEFDSDGLLQHGRCLVALNDHSAAEECFLAALEADEDNIDARIELASLYEKMQEREQAFILVQEVLSLQAQDPSNQRPDPVDHSNLHFVLDGRGRVTRKPRTYKKKGADGAENEPKKKAPKKPRMRRLAGDAQRLAFEDEVTNRLKHRYSICQSLKDRIEQGDREAMAEWMESAKELTDDFRSFREFYSWEKYVRYLGYDKKKKSSVGNSDLAAMADRLQQHLAPAEEEGAPEAQALARQEHRGIAFNDWLELFLEYAIGLAHTQRVQESYTICQAARDSLVYQQSDNMFLIHIAWATCAIYAGDEETCVAVARYFMRDAPFTTDGYRLYSAICRLCQAPSSWYNSGPAQKFMLRQIRVMDQAIMDPTKPTTMENVNDNNRPTELDACLLMIYGHILFTSTSYSYALNYFRRAISVDPTNPMAHLSVGLSYIHCAFKRQVDNRQAMIVQGLAVLSRYCELRLRSELSEERQEAHYNMARTYHMLGLSALAIACYGRVLDEAENSGCHGYDAREGFVVETAYNLRTYFLTMGDTRAAMEITKKWLVLE